MTNKLKIIERTTLLPEEREELDLALNAACKSNKLDMVFSLSYAGARPVYTEAISFMTEIKNREIFNYLWNLDLIDSSQHRLMFICAAENNNLELIQFLENNQLDFDHVKDYMLEVAAKNGCLEVVKFLIFHGVDPEIKSVLCRAAERGQLEVVKFLIESNTNIKSQIEDALDIGCYNGYEDMTLYLINKYPHLLKEKEKQLMFASVMSENISLIEKLIKLGGNIHINNEKPIMHAASEEKEEIVKYLIQEHGCNLNDVSAIYKHLINQELLEWNNNYWNKVELKNKLNENLSTSVKNKQIKKL